MSGERVKRYVAGLNGTAFMGMLETQSDNAFVAYSDYARLEAKLARMTANYKTATEWHDEATQQVIQLQHALEAAKDDLERKDNLYEACKGVRDIAIEKRDALEQRHAKVVEALTLFHSDNHVTWRALTERWGPETAARARAKVDAALREEGMLPE